MKWLRHDKALSPVFVVFMWMRIAITILFALYIIPQWTTGKEPFGWPDISRIAADIVIIIGAFLLIKANRWGFYLLMGVHLYTAIMVTYHYFEPDLEPDVNIITAFASYIMYITLYVVWSQVVFLLLIMLFSKNGKNVYQVLWGKK